jgi:hypothetical protein
MTFRNPSTALLTCILLAASANPAFSANLFANPGFETPATSAATVRNIDGSAASSVGGWLTTHPIGSFCSGMCRPIELWSNHYIVPASEGVQIMELNSIQRNMVFQSLAMAPGDVLNWSFHHRGRSSATSRDTMEFRIGIPSGLPTGSLPADAYSFPIVRVGTTNTGATNPPAGSGTINPPVALANGWVRYSGSYQLPTTVVAGNLNIGFIDTGTSGGKDIGNLVDGVSLEKARVVDPCCPPWNPQILIDSLQYVGSGSIGAPYTLKLVPSSATINSLRLYLNYIHSTNAALTALQIEFQLYDQGNGANPYTNGYNGIGVGPVSGMGFNANNTVVRYHTGYANTSTVYVGTATPGTSTSPSSYPMQVGKWYFVHTGMWTDAGKFFPDKCANNDAYVRIQALRGAKKAENGYVMQISNGREIVKSVPIPSR